MIKIGRRLACVSPFVFVRLEMLTIFGLLQQKVQGTVTCTFTAQEQLILLGCAHSSYALLLSAFQQTHRLLSDACFRQAHAAFSAVAAELTPTPHRH